MSQLLDFEDTDVEKHAVFFRHLLPHLKTHGETVETVDLSDVELVHIRQKEIGQHSLDLAEGEKVPVPPAASAAGSKNVRVRTPGAVLGGVLLLGRGMVAMGTAGASCFGSPFYNVAGRGFRDRARQLLLRCSGLGDGWKQGLSRASAHTW